MNKEQEKIRKSKKLFESYKQELSQLVNIGDNITNLGYFPDDSIEYFNNEGYKIENMDFGLCQHQITKKELTKHS